MIARVVIALCLTALGAIGVVCAPPRRSRGVSRAWPATLAVAASAPITYFIAFGIPAFPPGDALERAAWLLVFIAGAAVLIASVGALRDKRWLLLAAPLGVVAPQALDDWSILRTIATLIMAFTGSLVFTLSLEVLSRRAHSAAAAIILAFSSAAIAVALAGAANLTLAVIAASMIVPALTLACAIRFRPGATVGAVAYTAAAASLACMLTVAWSYTADLPIRTHVALPLLPFCPVLGAIADRYLCAHLRPRLAAVARVGMPVLGAAALAAIAFTQIGE